MDRYGQPRAIVRALTFYGHDNPVDGIVLRVLLRKHKAIHEALGITVPIPMDTQVIEDAIMHGLLLREHQAGSQLALDWGLLEPIYRPVDIAWDAAAEREERSRTVFAQNQLLEAVNRDVRLELDVVRRAIGGQADVEHFVTTAVRALGGRVVPGAGPGAAEGGCTLDLRRLPRSAMDAIGAGGPGGPGGNDDELAVSFSGRPDKRAIQLTRTHPVVEGLAAHVLETALDPDMVGPGRRCGVIRTRAVATRTTLLVLRMRFHIVTQDRRGERAPLLAEDLAVVAFQGSPERATWLSEDQALALIDARPDANIDREQAENAIDSMLERLDSVYPHLDQVAHERGQALLDAHRRVRQAAHTSVRALDVDVHTPADVLGVFVYLPVAGSAS